LRKGKKIELGVGIGIGAIICLMALVYFLEKATELPQQKVDDLVSDATGLLFQVEDETSDQNGIKEAQQANTEIDQALAIDPNNIDALLKKGEVSIFLGKYNDGITYSAKVLNMYPNQHFALKLKALALEFNNKKYINQTSVRKALQELHVAALDESCSFVKLAMCVRAFVF
jgi:tetratricopeptide (TPR) repeat protein